MKKINPGHVLVAGCCLALMLGVGFGIGITLKATQASRNSSGTYSLATSPVVSNQVITPSLWNNSFNDLAADMTLSLDRNGRGGMLSQLRGIDGTLAAPALSFTSETGSGLWRNGAGDVRMSILGALREQWSATGAQITGSLGVGVAPAWPLHVQGPTASALQARFGASGDTPIGLFSAVTNPAVSANATNDGSTGWKYATSNSTLALLAEMGASGYIIYTGPIGTAGNAVTFTERLRVNASGTTIGASGTAISGSFRGSSSLTPGSIPANSCATLTALTVTGAAAGSECALAVPGTSGVFSFYCVAGSNNCIPVACNVTVGAATPASGTYACRVFNP